VTVPASCADVSPTRSFLSSPLMYIPRFPGQTLSARPPSPIVRPHEARASLRLPPIRSAATTSPHRNPVPVAKHYLRRQPDS
jgi:hypothetical protein